MILLKIIYCLEQILPLLGLRFDEIRFCLCILIWRLWSSWNDVTAICMGVDKLFFHGRAKNFQERVGPSTYFWPLKQQQKYTIFLKKSKNILFLTHQGEGQAPPCPPPDAHGYMGLLKVWCTYLTLSENIIFRFFLWTNVLTVNTFGVDEYVFVNLAVSLICMLVEINKSWKTTFWIR